MGAVIPSFGDERYRCQLTVWGERRGSCGFRRLRARVPGWCPWLHDSGREEPAVPEPDDGEPPDGEDEQQCGHAREGEEEDGHRQWIGWPPGVLGVARILGVNQDGHRGAIGGVNRVPHRERRAGDAVNGTAQRDLDGRRPASMVRLCVADAADGPGVQDAMAGWDNRAY